ncbi:MAG: hypothetical protein RL490_1375 [Pseudomonadota bacterium]|jgi:hypothetical protein
MGLAQHDAAGQFRGNLGENFDMTTRTLRLALLLGLAAPALAQQPAAAPAPTAETRPGTPMTPMPAGVSALNGQNGDQAQLDVSQCQNGATQATGFIPGASAPAPAAPQGPKGERVTGAAVGAATTAIMGGDVGAGAAAGAVVGGSKSRQNRRQASAQQQKAAAAAQQKAQAWQNSYAACLTARGYALAPPPAPAPAAK